MATITVQNLGSSNFDFTNTTGADMVSREFGIIAGQGVMANNDVDDGVIGSFYSEDGALLQIDTFVTGELTFATVGAPVYWKQADLAFSDTSTSGYQLVGYVAVAKTGGVVKMFMRRWVTTVA